MRCIVLEDLVQKCVVGALWDTDLFVDHRENAGTLPLQELQGGAVVNVLQREELTQESGRRERV
jgi:hypothetical protein